jgi:hypothetical protein
LLKGGGRVLLASHIPAAFWNFYCNNLQLQQPILKTHAIKFPKLLSATATPALSAQNSPAALQQFFNLI